MTRPAQVVVDLAALRHNLSQVRKHAPGRRIIAIVKADAYGHGIVRVANTLRDADAFGVACIEEAVELREAGVTAPVVLLEGPYSESELPDISGLGLDIVIHNDEQLRMVEQDPAAAPAGVWIKLDSGMHRLGFDPDRAADVHARLVSRLAGAAPVRLMTHLAAANEPGNEMTNRQLAVFERACAGLEAERSIANSAAILCWPQSHADWIRPGLMLYGVSPVEGRDAAALGLRPVMTLRSRLISIRNVRAGESIGYGASWRCPGDMSVGVVAAGYADGFPRHARTDTPVVVNGRRTRTLGNASMDMITVDLSSQPQARVGDPVEIWGPNIPIEEVAAHAGTVPYELLCGVHKRLLFLEHG